MTEAGDVGGGSRPFFTNLILLTAKANVFAELFVSLHPQNNRTFKRMGSIFIIQGILIYIYAFDHRSTSGATLGTQEPAAHPRAQRHGQLLHHLNGSVAIVRG